MRVRASIFSANKYFQIKVLNPYRVFVDRYERDSVVVGIVGMCIIGCLMELWVTLFAECGKAVLYFPCSVNRVIHDSIACY